MAKKGTYLAENLKKLGSAETVKPAFSKSVNNSQAAHGLVVDLVEIT